MIEKIRIKNFALISNLELDFKKGITILSGETGAGKSIIVEAINFLFGSRAYSEMIKDGCEELSVEAEFAIDKNKFKELNLDGDKINIKRIYSRLSKNKTYINSKNVSLSFLENLGKKLVDFHGQNENQSLIESKNQMHILDKFSGLEKELSRFESKYNEKNELEEKIKNISMSNEERERLIDLYKFQLQEIEKLDIEPDKDGHLADEIMKLKNVDKINRLSNEIAQLLDSSDNSAYNTISKAHSKILNLSEIYPNLPFKIEDLEELKNKVKIIADAFKELVRDCEYSSEEIDFLIARHEKLKNLQKKYGEDLNNIISKKEELRVKINELENNDYNLSDLNQRLEKIKSHLLKSAEDISAIRKKNAEKLSKLILKELSELGFERAKFSINVDFDSANLNSCGCDSVEFLFSSNPDQLLKPIRYVASGGEISRVTLAIKSAISDINEVDTLIFDEIDSGVGGNTIFSIGRKFKKLSKNRQIIAITHMAQLACFADFNIRVVKKIKNNKTEIEVKELAGEEKVIEISRMLGSKYSEKTAMEHARELIKTAEKS